MTTQTITITNPFGVHVRPASVIVREMTKFPNVKFELDIGNGFNSCMGIMSLMTFELVFGRTVELRATGPNEEEACTKIAELLGSEFECDKVGNQTAPVVPPDQAGSSILTERNQQ